MYLRTYIEQNTLYTCSTHQFICVTFYKHSNNFCTSMDMNIGMIQFKLYIITYSKNFIALFVYSALTIVLYIRRLQSFKRKYIIVFLIKYRYFWLANTLDRAINSGSFLILCFTKNSSKSKNFPKILGVYESKFPWLLNFFENGQIWTNREIYWYATLENFAAIAKYCK